MTPQLQPRGWRKLHKPRLAAPEDIVLYELHVRDFSATDATVPADQRGTFAAFTQKRSDGMKHLATLGLAGVTHVHLLPSFDFATTNEDKSTWESPSFDTLAALPPDSSEQQALVAATADRDAFNWGYDPLHYNVPEGSYATDADGSARMLEFRQMVQSLNQSGLRVVMDVVYNHTNSAGQNPNSILDKLVPGYYHRLNGDGVVLGESCCADTATEHAMMEKLMVDSIVLWAKQYKVDGFRFDIMGFHLKSNMLKVRAALDALTLAKDGVDGKSVYVYGEGWNFGVMANNGRGVNAIQVNMAGTGIGSFSDRIRDAVRGGGPFSPRRDQGFATGLYVEPNGTFGGSAADAKAELLRLTDLRASWGSPATSPAIQIVDATGATKPGSEVDYFGMPGAYGAATRGHDPVHRRARRSGLVRCHEPQAGDQRAARRPRAHASTRTFDRGAVAGRAVLHGRRRDPAFQVRGPEQLQLRRLVQPHRLDAEVQQLGRGPAAGARQPGRLVHHRARARRSQPEAQREGHRGHLPSHAGDAASSARPAGCSGCARPTRSRRP